MNIKKESKKGYNINTEKLYLFRRLCEEYCKERYTGINSFKHMFSISPRWIDIQSALSLIGIYEECSIEDIKKQLYDIHSPIKEKIIKMRRDGHYIPERQYWEKLFKRK